MWHSFDLMPPEDLLVVDAVRSASAPAACRIVYGDRILARFPTKDKIGTDKQWRPQVDRLPGLTLTRQRRSADGWELAVEQRWQFASVDHGLTGTITADATDWRSPRTWQFQQTMTPNDKSRPMTPLVESAAWNTGKVERTCKAGRGTESSSHAAPTLTSLYTLVADFPLEFARRGGGKVEGFLSEGFAFSPSAELREGHAVQRSLPRAKGLHNYLLTFPGGLPYEFWVNETGVVVYLCRGPAQTFVLQRVEPLA